MGPDEAWIDKFLRSFVRRLSPADWPGVGTEDFDDFRGDWAEVMERHKVSGAEADAAVRRLKENPPRWLSEHIPRFLAAVLALRKERAAESSSSDREIARAASLACEYCHGDGQVQVYDPMYDGRSVVDRDCVVKGEVRNIPFAMRVVAHCSCAMGRWMRSKTPVDLLPRIPDHVDVLAGRTRWMPMDPTSDGPVIFPEGVSNYREYWRYLVAMMRNSEATGGIVHVRDGRPVRGEGVGR